MHFSSAASFWEELPSMDKFYDVGNESVIGLQIKRNRWGGRNGQSIHRKTWGGYSGFMGLCLIVWYIRGRFSEIRGNIRNHCDNKKSGFFKRKQFNTSEDQETSGK